MYPSNIKNECYTPKWFIDIIRSHTGEIHLDPFSCDFAQEVIRAYHYFTEEYTALEHDWLEHIPFDHPTIWVQPPYSRDLIEKCVIKTLLYIDKAEIYLLVNSSTSAKWYQKCVAFSTAMVFPMRRIQFFNPYTEFKNRNDKDQTLFYFGKHADTDFILKMSAIGQVVVKRN